MAIKKKPPATIREMLKPYGFNDAQIKLVILGINIVTSHHRTQRIVEGLVKTGPE